MSVFFIKSKFGIVYLVYLLEMLKFIIYYKSHNDKKCKIRIMYVYNNTIYYYKAQEL